MAFIEDAVEGGLGVGAIVGVGVLLAWPLVRPVVREGTKLAIKGGMGLYEWGAQAVAEAQGGVRDLATEARQDADRHEASSARRRHGSADVSTASEG